MNKFLLTSSIHLLMMFCFFANPGESAANLTGDWELTIQGVSRSSYYADVFLKSNGTFTYVEYIDGYYDWSGSGAWTYNSSTKYLHSTADGARAVGTISGTEVNFYISGSYEGHDVTYHFVKQGNYEVLWYRDYDNDGYGSQNNSTSSASQPSGYVSNSSDCNDYDRTIHPGATEIRGDGIDQDCNGWDLPSLTTYYRDSDGDGYGNPDDTTESVSRPYGYNGRSGDCDDSDSSIHPGATEIRGDGIDQDCNGSDLESLITYYYDGDSDGYGDPNTSYESSSQPTGYVTNNTDCNDNNQDIHPGATESENYVDDNCDGIIDNIIPVKASLESPSGSIEERTPTLTWNENPHSTWYKLFVWDSSEKTVYAQWYDSSDICSGGNCSVTLESELLVGEYEWFVKSWNDYGKIWSDGMDFTVQGDDTPPSKVTHTSPSGQLASSTSIFTWVADPASTWYRLWVGHPGDIKVFAQWYEASEICSDDSCSVTFETELMDGDYEWYIKSWNDYGKVWSDGMSFSVDAVQ